MLRPKRQLLPMETLRQGKQPSAEVVDDQRMKSLNEQIWSLNTERKEGLKGERNFKKKFYRMNG
jgi:hypothetical protein